MSFESAASFYSRMTKESIACEICGSQDHMLILSVDRYSMGIQTVFCKYCGFLFTNPRPTESEMIAFYQDAYRLLYTGTEDPALDFKKSSPVFRRARYLADSMELESVLKKSQRILDVGCGSGILLHFIKKKFPDIEIYGVEPDRRFARYAHETASVELLGADVNSMAVPKFKFDLIILNHVLEHLYHPVEKLKKLHSLLADQGSLLVEVPDWPSSKWPEPLEMFHPTHIQHFCDLTLKNALSRAGFSSFKKLQRNNPVNPWAITYLCEKSSLPPPPLSAFSPSEQAELQKKAIQLKNKIERPSGLEKFQKILLRNRAAILAARIWEDGIQEGFFKTFKKILLKLREIFLNWIWDHQFQPVLSWISQKPRPEDQKFLRAMIEGRRVLVLGSGASAKELQEIPKDVLIFTCNRGLQFFETFPLNRPVDFFLCTESKIQRFPQIREALQNIPVRALALDHLHHQGSWKETPRLIPDDGMHDEFLRSLIHPLSPKEIRGKSFHPWTSTGIRLIQYALHFNAKEIYVIGIDLGRGDYFWGKNFDRWLHDEIDANFLKIAAKKYPNLFSLSAASPLSRWLPHQTLTA